jgi:hypothetical protein
MIEYGSSTAELIIGAYAYEEGVSFRDLYDTLLCESGLRANAIGDGGTSLGIAQIHLSSHPDISKAEALDPYFSIHWAARQFALGRQSMWTCAREQGIGE